MRRRSFIDGLIHYRPAERGFDVTVAVHGGEAPARVQEEMPDAVVLDVMMKPFIPEELVPRLTSLPEGPDA